MHAAVLGMRVLAALASAQLASALSTSTEDFRAGISRGFPSRRAAGAPVVVVDDAAASESSRADDIVRESGSWHLQIDEDWAGLRRVSDAPRVYYVEGLLSAAECDALIAKATPERLTWGGDSTGRADRRTSRECRLGYDEVAGLQRRFAKLLRTKTSHFEPLKLTRYGPGAYFSYHHDALAYGGYPGGARDCATAYCNRVATIILYLNDCAGGETRFTHLDLAFPPRRGDAVVHFPAFTADSRVPPELRGVYDSRVGHEGAPVADGEEKFICQQWAWTGALDRYAAPPAYRPDGRWDGNDPL